MKNPIITKTVRTKKPLPSDVTEKINTKKSKAKLHSATAAKYNRDAGLRSGRATGAGATMAMITSPEAQIAKASSELSKKHMMAARDLQQKSWQHIVDHTPELKGHQVYLTAFTGSPAVKGPKGKAYLAGPEDKPKSKKK